MRPGTIVLLILGIALAAGCLAPGGPAPTPAPTPTSAGPYTVPGLKYLLLDYYGESRFFFCDPDYYPVGRGDELQRALASFPGIENETVVFPAIVAHGGFQPPYSNDTILAIYREYKKLNAIPLDPVSPDTYSFSLRLGTAGQGQLVTGIIRSDGVIESENIETAVLTCPICLAGDTRIDTPAGPVPVKDIREGMIVWSLDGHGNRIGVPVLVASKTPVPPSHHLVHLRLSDGRELSASPGHPLADGRLVGTLSPGDVVDGARVTVVDTIPITGEYTYDILPAGVTGGYWANGIPLESTLFSDPRGT
jgi:hypothetical protein